MARLEWDKARKRSQRRYQPEHRKDNARQEALTAFVQAHQLDCFKCHQTQGPWAKTGIVQTTRYAWALCTTCAASDKQPGSRPEEPTQP